MRLMAFFLTAALLATPVLGTDLKGTWKAMFTGPIDERPKTVSEITFTLNSTESKITGTAHLGNWPGEVELVDGKIDDDRITFTAVGKSAWWSKSSTGDASGLPKLTFTCTIGPGGGIKVKLLWDNVMIYGEKPAPVEYEMVGSKNVTATF